MRAQRYTKKRRKLKNIENKAGEEHTISYAIPKDQPWKHTYEVTLYRLVGYFRNIYVYAYTCSNNEKRGNKVNKRKTGYGKEKGRGNDVTLLLSQK